MIEENLKEIQREMEAACKKSGRSLSDVRLIAVSKTKPAEMVLEAYRAGVRDFGENKVQEILEKAPALPQDIRWHMIGHLQKNKVRQVVGKVVLIHSVDSVSLAEQIEKEAAKQGCEADILLEVNIGLEEATHFTEAQMRFLTTCNRTSKKGLRPRMYYTCNPGGPGHGWVKRLFAACS